MPVSPVKKSLMGSGPTPSRANRQVETGKANPPAENQQHEKGSTPAMEQHETGSVPYDRLGQPKSGGGPSYGRDGQPK